VLEDIKNIKCTTSNLRKFGLLIGAILAVLGGLCLWKQNQYYSYLFILATGLIGSGVLYPLLLKPFYLIWMTIATILGWIMTRIILCIVFYFIVTPIGFFARLLGKQFLRLKIDANADSYWIKKDDVPFEKKDYENQY